MVDQDLHAAAFPRLDKAQLAALEGCPLSKLKHYRDGEKLFEAGQCDCNFYVVKTGAVEIVDDAGDEPKVVATLGPGEFTGEVAQLTGGPAIFSGVARGESDVFEVSNDALREIMNVHPNLGDVILRAFMARRHLLHEMGDFTGLRVFGSRYSKDTLRVREFLAKNLVPFTWMDLEDDPQVKQFLEQAGLTEAEARAAGHTVSVLRWPFAENDRAVAEGDTAGLVKLVLRGNRVLGAGIVAPAAGEMIGIWALAIAQRTSLSSLAGMILPYPTRSEAGKRAAGAFYEPRLFSPLARRIVGALRYF